jgi:hypothetical protein
MRITLHRTGGLAAIPGLEVHAAVDTATLPTGEAAELEAAARSAKRDGLPTAPPSPDARDQRTYELTIQDGSETRSALFHDPIPTQGLRDLVKLLSSRSGSPS